MIQIFGRNGLRKLRLIQLKKKRKKTWLSLSLDEELKLSDMVMMNQWWICPNLTALMTAMMKLAVV
jgi:hypothetical protein